MNLKPRKKAQIFSARCAIQWTVICAAKPESDLISLMTSRREKKITQPLENQLYRYCCLHFLILCQFQKLFGSQLEVEHKHKIKKNSAHKVIGDIPNCVYAKLAKILDDKLYARLYSICTSFPIGFYIRSNWHAVNAKWLGISIQSNPYDLSESMKNMDLEAVWIRPRFVEYFVRTFQSASNKSNAKVTTYFLSRF